MFEFLDSYAIKRFGGGSGHILSDGFMCDGNEASLSGCQLFLHPHDCDHSKDAGVRCLSGKLI